MLMTLTFAGMAGTVGPVAAKGPKKVELKKEGNNFNQTVRLWNKTQSATPPAVFTMAYRRLSDLYAQISKMLEGVKNADIQSSGE